MAKKLESIEDFELTDDESAGDSEVKVIRKPVPKKVVKLAPPSQVVSVRLPTKTVNDIERSGINMADLFKAFVEKEITCATTCPTCGQERKKKK
jgi:hypothetical protein